MILKSARLMCLFLPSIKNRVWMRIRQSKAKKLIRSSSVDTFCSLPELFEWIMSNPHVPSLFKLTLCIQSVLMMRVRRFCHSSSVVLLSWVLTNKMPVRLFRAGLRSWRMEASRKHRQECHEVSKRPLPERWIVLDSPGCVGLHHTKYFIMD